MSGRPWAGNYSGKTVAMLISPSRSRIPTIDFRINLDGAEMKFVKQTRLLGIIIDDSLSWSYHIDSVCCKVGRKIGALRRSFRLLTPHARRTFFISVIQPDLEYAALTFTPSMNAGLRNRLLAVWRKAIRCAAGVGYQDEVTPLLSEFRLTNIVDRWIVQFACHVRRCVKQEAPSTSCAKLQTASSLPLHQRTGEFLSSVPGEQLCWSCIFFEPCSTSLELFTC